MNLIERAANRLARDAEKAAPAVPDDAAPGVDGDVGRERTVGRADMGDGVAARASADSARATAAPHSTGAPGQRRSRDGIIDLDRLRQAGMIPPPDGAIIVEEFRDIARPLLENAFAHRDTAGPAANVILLTSALSGEGKTFCAINLALTIALESERQVLLVDADVAKPSLAQSLGLEVDLGLVDRLLDETIDLSDALIRTDVPCLSVLAAGREHRYGTDLLSSVAMARLIDELGSRYNDRLILIDAPPVLTTVDVQALAAQVGQIVMVVEADSTPQNVAKDALAKLADCPMVQLLLNKRSDRHRIGVALEPDVSQEE